MPLRTDVSLSAIVAGFVTVLVGFTRELVLTIAGLAQLGAIGNGLATALSNEKEREPAFVTFLVTVSGVTLLSILGIARGRSRVVDFAFAAGWVGIARRRASIGSWQGRRETPQQYWLVAHAPDVILSAAKDLLLVFCRLRKADPSLRSG